MIKIKICGLTRGIDVEYVNKLRPEYAGFVFAKSRRKLSIDTALKLRQKLNKDIKAVGIFVNEDIEIVQEIAKKVKLDVLQFHGEEDIEYTKNFKNFEVWKAIPIKNKDDISNIYKYKNIRLLLDSKVDGIKGGSGKSFDWNILKGHNLEDKIILAGGLNCENVQDAIKTIHPFAVDVSSGIEVNGFKDFNKMKKFIDKVREFK